MWPYQELGGTLQQGFYMFLLQLEMVVSTAPWYAFVPTPSSIADDPSRGCTKHLDSGGAQRMDPATELTQILEVLAESAVNMG